MFENYGGSRILTKDEAIKKLQLELNEKTLELTVQQGKDVRRIANDNISSRDLMKAKRNKSFDPLSCGPGLEQEKVALFITYLREPNKWLTKSAQRCRNLCSDKTSVYNEKMRNFKTQYNGKMKDLNDYYEKEEITRMNNTPITPDSHEIPELHDSDKELKIAEITAKFSDKISALKIEFLVKSKQIEDLRNDHADALHQKYDMYLVKVLETQEDSNVKEVSAKALEIQKSEMIVMINAQKNKYTEDAQNVLNNKIEYLELLRAKEIQNAVDMHSRENVSSNSSSELAETAGNDDDVLKGFKGAMHAYMAVKNNENLDFGDSKQLDTQTPIKEKLNSPDENSFAEFDDNPFTEGIDKIKELQKIISKDLRSNFSDPASVVDAPVKFNEKQKELSVAKMVEFSKSLSQMGDKLGAVESYVDHIKGNIKIAEAALGEWKKRVKQAKKALKDEELGQKEVLSFLKDEAIEMVKFINSVLDKEKKKIAEVSKIIQTFHLLNYKLKSGIFEETKPFLFDSSYDKQLEHLELSQELDIVIRKIEPNLKKKLMP